MQSRQHPLVFLATTLLLTLTAQSSRAIDIEGQPGLIPNNTYSLSFFPGEGVGITTLSTYDPLFPSSELHPFGEVYEIQRGGTPGLLGDLQTFIDRGWYFQTGRDLTESSFVISRYYACGVHTPCGIGAYPEPRTGGAGSVFSLNYIPRSNDPQPGSQNPLYWIQRVITNYPSSAQGSFGVRRTYIDNSGRSTPYSIGGLPLNSNGYFIDRPYRPIINGNTYNKNFYWIGELYLAEELQNTQDITIYNGVRWGWRYDFGRQVKQFFDFLSSGNEEDNFLVDNLPAGAKFYAYTNNDVPGNRCNPNTYLTVSGEGGYSDDNSSPVGDGFGSALRGTVPSNGTINLRVRAANGGARGEDRGSYELSVLVFDEKDAPIENVPPVVAAGSGGGGVGNESRGRTQNNPILPGAIEQGGWQVFRNVPGCRWYDPTTSYGFEFQALDDTLFTEILDFPTLPDNQFTVSVGDTVVGSYGPGQSLDFVSLLGQGVSNFKITGIDSKGSTEETAFPIQLAFNDRVGSFKMRPFTETVLDKTDDGSFGPFSLGFNMPFFGQTYNSFYVNNNGNISFGKSLGAFSPQSVTTQNLAPMIAPYWADVDTRGTVNVSVLTGIPNEVTVTWDKVGYYSQRTDKTATFGLVMQRT